MYSFIFVRLCANVLKSNNYSYKYINCEVDQHDAVL